jgi:DNA-binding MarR family transcriptional regulator
MPASRQRQTKGTEPVSPLARELKKRRDFDLPEEEAFLNILRTGIALAGPFEAVFKEFGLSEATYNVLRILRGAGDRGRMCSEISEHMVARVPDVTRLVDRLESMGLAERRRCSEDRRAVYVAITPKGIEAANALDTPVRRLHKAQLSHLTKAELGTLNKLLVKARERVTRPNI